MFRRLFTFMSVMSLLLCVGMCVLWGRSIGRRDETISSIGSVLIDEGRIDGRFRFGVVLGFPERQQFRRRSGSAGSILSVADFAGWPAFDLKTSTLWRVFGLYGFLGQEYPFFDDNGHVACYDKKGLPDALRERNRGKPLTYWNINDAPFWLPVLALTTMPTAWLILQLSRHSRSKRACKICGYDLRATPERCPECGNVA